MQVLRNEKGFTLIELVLIIVILGILAAVATVQFGTIMQDSKDAAIRGGAGGANAQLATAINAIQALPTVAAGTGACVTNGTQVTFADTVYECLTFSGGGIFKGPLAAGNNAFAICTGAATCTSVGANCGAITERFVTVTYTAVTGALAITNPGPCSS